MERKEEGQPANPARKYSFEEDNYVPVPQQPTRRPELRPDSNLLNHLRRAPQDAVRHPQGNLERDREAAMVVTRTEMMEAKERFRGGQQKTATIPRSARKTAERVDLKAGDTIRNNETISCNRFILEPVDDPTQKYNVDLSQASYEKIR